MFLKHFGATIIFLSFAISIGFALDSQSLHPKFQDTLFFRLYNYLLALVGLLPMKSKIYDAFVNFVSASFCNLFIRRLLNPDSAPVAFEKYSVDAVFGGIASAAQVFVKYMLR